MKFKPKTLLIFKYNKLIGFMIIIKDVIFFLVLEKKPKNYLLMIANSLKSSHYTAKIDNNYCHYPSQC